MIQSAFSAFAAVRANYLLSMVKSHYAAATSIKTTDFFQSSLIYRIGHPRDVTRGREARSG